MKIDPNYSEAYIGLGMIYLRQFRLEEAEEVLKRGLKTNPDKKQLSNMKNLLVVIDYAKGDLDSREDILKKLLQEEPKNAHYHYELGKIYLEKNNPEAADKEFKRALELKPTLILKYPELKNPKYRTVNPR